MSRTLPPAVVTNIGKTITQPTWLAEISYSTPLRMTSGAVIVFDALTFSFQGLEVREVREDAATFIVRNNDSAISALVSDEGANDIPCRIWKYYETDGALLFDGFLDGCRIERKEVRFDAVRLAAQNSSFPERLFTRALFPWMPVGSDRTIRWGPHRITLETER